MAWHGEHHMTALKATSAVSASIEDRDAIGLGMV